MTKIRIENARYALHEMTILQEANYNALNFGIIDISKQIFNNKDNKENFKYFEYVHTYTTAFGLFGIIEKMIQQLENKKNIDLQIYDFAKDKDSKSYTIEFIQRTKKYNLYFSYTLCIRNKEMAQ